MNRLHFTAASALCVFLSGCDKSPPPPSSASSNQGGLSGLTETPQSYLGKSAKMGKDAARSIEAEQAQASGMADEINGSAKMTTVGGLEFRPPEAWRPTTPSSKMQALALLVADDEGGGETVCSFLTGIGGSAGDNVERWKGVVTEPGSSIPAEAKVVTRNVPGGLKVTTVYSQGTYSSMASGAAKPMKGFGFRGAIVEGGPSGLIFVRLTGPAEKVKAATGAFEQLVFGVRKP